MSVEAKKRVLCFGEILIRFSPDADGAWLKNSNVFACPAGSEANVAANLAVWNQPSAYLTAMPENFLSHHVKNYLAGINVDVSNILFTGDRLGVYYLPKGKDIKNAGLIYDRAGSAFSSLQPGMIDWNKILDEAAWLHFSAIAPALCYNLVDVLKEAFEIATSKNIPISVDLNFRSLLWKYGKKPADVMPELIQYCDVVMGNIWAASNLLGIAIDETKINANATKEDYLAQALETSKTISDRFPKVKSVANTFRFDSGTQGIKYYGTLYNDQQLLVSKEYNAEKIIDKVGSGDCFMAGLIYGMINHFSVQQTLEYAAAAAFTKLFVETDITKKSADDIKFFITHHDN